MTSIAQMRAALRAWRAALTALLATLALVQGGAGDSAGTSERSDHDLPRSRA
jgi:hypothetical protein